MNSEALFLFLILLLGLVLCSFLGGNYNQEYSTNNDDDSDDSDDSDDDYDDDYHDSSMQLTKGYSFYEGYDNYSHYTGKSTVLPHGAIYYDKKMEVWLG